MHSYDKSVRFNIGALGECSCIQQPPIKVNGYYFYYSNSFNYEGSHKFMDYFRGM
jgi:hypothetical protein